MAKITANLKSINHLSANIICADKMQADIKNSKLIVSDAAPYKGDYEVTPKAFERTILETKDKVLAENVSVLEIPFYNVSNESGTTIYIGNEVNLNGN